MLDTSGSSLNRQALNQALSACAYLCQQAYLSRQHCALISFGNNQAQLLIPPRRAIKHLPAYLAQVEAGGGTPLRLGLLKAQQLLEQYRQRYTQQTLYLLSDGRSTDAVAGIELPCPLVVIDTEQTRVPLGRARRLAEQLNAEYLSLASLQAAF